jgi:predicted nucleotidyltransferase component of viral defense system
VLSKEIRKQKIKLAGPIMVHKDKQAFKELILVIANRTGFKADLIEKDYYLTLILSKIDELCPNLAFKGGACLNKVYFDHHRLSEDLDFTMILPKPNAEMPLSERAKLIEPIKEKIENFAEKLNIQAVDIEKSGRKDSKIHNFKFVYDSVILNSKEIIKMDISLIGNPIVATEKNEIKHKFFNSAGEPIINASKVQTLSLNELIAEKMLAGAKRKEISARDFYDLNYAVKKGFDFTNKEFLDVLKKRFELEAHNSNIKLYTPDLGRNEQEKKEMKEQLPQKLYPVINEKQQAEFDTDKVFKNINNALDMIVREEAANYDAYNPNYESIENGEKLSLPLLKVKIQNTELEKKYEKIEWRDKEIKERIKEIETIVNSSDYTRDEKIAINEIFATEKGAKIIESSSFNNEARIIAGLYLGIRDEKYVNKLSKANQVTLQSINEAKVIEIDDGMSR